MLTTTLKEQSRTESETESAVAPRKRDPSVPAHLAVVLNAGAGQKSPTLKVAIDALDALLAGCSERGVAVLTLLHPSGETEIFEAALAGLRASPAFARRSGVQLNLRSTRDGRGELVEAIKALGEQARSGKLLPENIDARAMENCLITRGLPPVDLLISTGGGMRLSGALLWQCAYAELLFVDVAWFDFNRDAFSDALADYAKRCRKFGGLVS